MNSLLKYFQLLVFLFLLSSCISKRYILETHFDESAIPSPPDYSNENTWASLPSKKDPADSLPGKNLINNQATAEADVFFIHPTLFTYKPTTPYQWNGDVNDADLNKKTDNSTILYQASVFNGSCKIYAPRYRQAHISAFYSTQREDAKNALNLAYSDVKTAFQYYLDHFNNGRPIIIASHSQGTYHAKRLLNDFFKNTDLMNRLVAAYLVGLPVSPDSLNFISPCNTPDQTGCYCTWNTFARDYYPTYYDYGLVNAICTNPLSWTTDTTYSAATLNAGGVLLNFEKVYPNLCSAQVHDGMLWIDKPDFPGSKFVKLKIYHRADYNLFYFNIRENVQLRIDAFRKNNASTFPEGKQ